MTVTVCAIHLQLKPDCVHHNPITYKEEEVEEEQKVFGYCDAAFPHGWSSGRKE